MLLERAGRTPLPELASRCAGSLPGSRLPREGAWDDALVLVPSPSSCIRSRPKPAPPQPLPERERGKNGGGLERLGEGRRGSGERGSGGGGNLSPSQCLRLFSLPLAATRVSLHTLSEFLAPSPPTLPRERAEREPQLERGRGRRGRRWRWACACM